MGRDEIIILVNEQDDVLGFKKRKDLVPSDIFRIVSCVFIDKDKKKVLLCQRSFSKKYGPGKWSSSAAGGVEKGESYEDAIAKEVSEELGLKDLEFIPQKKTLRKGEEGVFMMIQQFVCYVSSDSVIPYNTEDFEQIRWVSLDELIDFQKTVDSNLYSNDLINELIEILKNM